MVSSMGEIYTEPPPKPPKLLEQLRHPTDLDSPEVETFLTHLVVRGNVAASTQNQALSALLFLYREVLHQDLP